MKALESIFGQSPFFPLQTHMLQVSRCVEALASIIEDCPQDLARLEKRAQSVSELEYLADMSKSQIRKSLGKTLFLPVNKEMLIQALSFQDGIADTSEGVAHLLSFRSLDMTCELGRLFKAFFKQNYDTFQQARALVQEYDAIVSTSFGGCEAERVDVMVEEVAIGEHECRRKEYELLRLLYARASTMPYYEFDLWQRVVRQTGQIAFQSEKLVYRIRRMLDNR